MKGRFRIDIVPAILFAVYVAIQIVTPSDTHDLERLRFYVSVQIFAISLLFVGCVLAAISLIWGIGSRAIALAGLVGCASPIVLLVVIALS